MAKLTVVGSEEYEQAAQRPSPLRFGDGGGTFGGMTTADPVADHEKRIWRLEAGVVAAFLVIMAAIGGLYLYIGGKADGLDDRLRTVEISAARSDEHTKSVDQHLDSIDKKLDAISDKLDRRP